jgi:hypothetical protein
MDQELIAYFEGFRKDVMLKLEQMGGRLEQMDGRLGRVEAGVRHNGVEIEGLRGELRLIAEAFVGLDERLASFRIDMAKEFTDFRSSIRQPFEYLDNRLRLIEARADNATRDVMALVRERLGKPPLPKDLA